MTTVGLSICLENIGVAQISGYNFNSMCVFNGKVLGCGDTGINEVGGTTDAGSSIVAFFEIPQTDLGLEKNKKFRAIQLDGYLKGNFTITPVFDEVEGTIYTVNGTGTYLNQTFEVNINSDEVGRLIGFKFKNVDGSDFSIRSAFALILPTIFQHLNQTGGLGRGSNEVPGMTISATGS